MKKLLKTQNVSFSYDEADSKKPVNALKDVSVEVAGGEFVAVLGANGSGKSTLAKHFNAVLLPSRGTVYIDSIDTKDESRVFDIRQMVGMVFQNPDNQIVATIVEEDVAFGLENIGIAPGEIRTRVNDALKVVGMYEYREHAPHQLSGGQKQRVAIAGVIAMRPKCIVLDEPTAMLDPRGREEVIKTIRTLNTQFGVTVVIITHYMNEAVKSDRVIVMDDGKIILDGTPREVFARVELLRSVGLDIPQSSELAYELIKSGVPLPGGILTEEECVEALAALLDKG